MSYNDLEWNMERHILYKFIISQLQYDGLNSIAVVLSDSLQQLSQVKPSDELSRLVSMCVQWGQISRTCPDSHQIGLLQSSYLPALRSLRDRIYNSPVQRSTVMEPSLPSLPSSLVTSHPISLLSSLPSPTPILPSLVSMSTKLEPEVSVTVGGEGDHIAIRREINGLAFERVSADTAQEQDLVLERPTELVMEHVANPGAIGGSRLEGETVEQMTEPASSPPRSPAENRPLQIDAAIKMDQRTSSTEEQRVIKMDQRGSSTEDQRGCDEVGEIRAMEHEAVEEEEVVEIERHRKPEEEEEENIRPPSPGGLGSLQPPKEEGELSPIPDHQQALSPGQLSFVAKRENLSPNLTVDLNEPGTDLLLAGPMGSFECPKCGTVICSMAEMAYHVKVCLNGAAENFCRECGRGYSSKASLQRHISVVHRKERNYECHICGKRFGQQIHVDVHMRLHTGEKPFVCHICNDSFKQSAHLKRHMQCHVRPSHTTATVTELPLYNRPKPEFSPYKRDLSETVLRPSPLSFLSSPDHHPVPHLPHHHRHHQPTLHLPGPLSLAEGLRTSPVSLPAPSNSQYTSDLMKLIGQSISEQTRSQGKIV